jgi:apolipoprotein D and lipocalin family protein
MNAKLRLILTAVLAISLSACASNGPDMDTVDYVDLERFMGEWYVIANIPTFIEKEAYNAVETYSLNDDGTIATNFTFRKGGFDGDEKEYNPKGFVKDTESNALWGMQFIWPIKADYRIVYLDEEYSQTVIGRKQRDYVWIMARTPTISDADYEKLIRLSESLGYEASEIRKVPQQWQ